MKKVINFIPFLLRSKEKLQADVYQQFIQQFPEFELTSSLDELRAKDFSRLDEQNHVYLDVTGGQLFGESLLKTHHDFLSKTILGNPHSINPSSAQAEKHIQATRKKVLSYFNAGDDYICIFTSNASTAMKIVGECYPFSKNGQLLMTVDNHNSVNGIREFARAKDCEFNYSPIYQNLRIDKKSLIVNLEKNGQDKLFAFPAQSNVSGVKHNLDLIKKAQEKGWDVLLDAAAFVPTDKLDLQLHQPEFVAISFYKMFGYPTGLGALLVKKSAYNKLKKPSFSGGTITIVSVKGDGHYLEQEAARFEEGTVNYLDIPAIKSGLEYIESIGIDKIKLRTSILTEYFLNELQKLRHHNGENLIKIYGPQTGAKRGATIAINFYDVKGVLYDFQKIEEMAFSENISIRTGCFCNPGIDETNHNLNQQKLQDYFKKEGAKNYFKLIKFIGQKRGAVRVSVGFINNFEDTMAFISFCSNFLDKEINKKFVTIQEST